MESKTNRRKFLGKGCAVTAAALVTICGGGAAAGIIRPSVDLPETYFGEKTMKKFIESNQAALGQKGYSLFISCMTLSEDTEANRAAVSAYLEPVRAMVKPVREGLFAGAMNLKKLPLIERMMIKMMKAPEGDFRKWEKITAWADGIS